MARKIFISYKYADSEVRALPGGGLVGTRARNYVDLLQAHLDANDHINKGENDDESLQGFKEEYIESKLRAKIFDSTITVVLISRNMKDPNLPETDQWIPWEISYSLKEMTKDDRTSSTNAMIAVVLPDRAGSYDYFIRENTCTSCGSRTIMTDALFEILRKNMFNRKTPKKVACGSHSSGNEPHMDGDHSYIYSVKWDDFIGSINPHLDFAVSLNANKDDFELVKTV